MKKKSELEAQLQALPDKRKTHKWTPEIDRLILKYSETKGLPAIAALLRIPYPTIESRFRKLRMES